MKKVLFDCDNTFGVPGCDVDDGLALLYLLGREDVDVRAVTVTYGNSQTDVTYEATRRLLRDVGREDIPVLRGGAGPGDYDSEAADYLAQAAREHPGELSLLATGSLTNLAGAWRKNGQFFHQLQQVVLMGGVTEPLVFQRQTMEELNFSCDPQASFTVLTEGKNVSVITGNNCLKVLFTKEEYAHRLLASGRAVGRYILDRTDSWFGYTREGYGIEGFYNWDVTAAVYLARPELFIEDRGRFAFSAEDLKTGHLRRDGAGPWACCLPEIGPAAPFKEEIYDAWERVEMGYHG